MAKGRRGTKARKGRKSSRKSSWRGGASQTVFPADVNSDGMSGMSKLSLAQGADYESLHQGQHGGAMVNLGSAAPVGYTGMLDDSLRGAARIEPLDQSMQGIQGMSDQSGGGRRRRRKTRSSRRKRSSHRKTRSMRRNLMKKGSNFVKNIKNRGSSLKRRLMKIGKYYRNMALSRRKMRGGSAFSLSHAQDVGAPGMLLSPAQEAQALGGMNPEWKLAEDPNAFAPV